MAHLLKELKLHQSIDLIVNHVTHQGGLIHRVPLQNCEFDLYGC